jgi:urease accessory protein UreH
MKGERRHLRFHLAQEANAHYVELGILGWLEAGDGHWTGISSSSVRATRAFRLLRACARKGLRGG